jgi:hypothetical protein
MKRKIFSNKKVQELKDAALWKIDNFIRLNLNLSKSVIFLAYYLFYVVCVKLGQEQFYVHQTIV